MTRGNMNTRLIYFRYRFGRWLIGMGLWAMPPGNTREAIRRALQAAQDATMDALQTP